MPRQARKLVANLNVNLDFDSMSDQEVAVWYNDNVIYPDKVRLNCYDYRHYSFIKGKRPNLGTGEIWWE